MPDARPAYKWKSHMKLERVGSSCSLQGHLVILIRGLEMTGRGSPPRVVALLLLVGMLLPARADSVVTDGLLPNGNFEAGPDKSQLNGTVVSGRYSIPNWEISGFVEYIESGHREPDMILAVPEGARAVRLGNDATIQQRLTVTRHAYYSITFSAARTCAQAEKLNVSVTPEFGVLPIQTVYTSSGWDSYSWAFKAKHSVVWLSIHNPGQEEDPACCPLIDFVAIKSLYPPRSNNGKIDLLLPP
ncbi:hypothetical protein ABZP36_007222 [Zizania latifolia]